MALTKGEGAVKILKLLFRPLIILYQLSSGSLPSTASQGLICSVLCSLGVEWLLDDKELEAALFSAALMQQESWSSLCSSSTGKGDEDPVKQLSSLWVPEQGHSRPGPLTAWLDAVQRQQETQGLLGWCFPRPGILRCLLLVQQSWQIEASAAGWPQCAILGSRVYSSTVLPSKTNTCPLNNTILFKSHLITCCCLQNT